MKKNNDFEIRFGVKNEMDLFSRIWKLWQSNNEIYIVDRNCGHKFKVSLHKSGNWQVSFSQDTVPEMQIKNQQRHIDKWNCPKNNLGSNFTLAFRIIIPNSELRIYKQKNKGKKIDWINSATNGDAREIGVILEHTLQHMKTGWPGSNNSFSLLGQGVLSNGEKLWLIYRDIKLTDNDIILLKTKKENGKNEGGAFLIGKEIDGSRKIMEVALN